MNDIVERIIIERNKKIDSLVFGEIKEMASENGIDTTITLNEKAIIEALKKQIPRKAILHGHNPYKLICSVYYTCPNCNKHISIAPCCDKCGQALDWSESNDKR